MEMYYYRCRRFDRNMSQLGLEKGRGAALFLRRQQAAEQSAIVKGILAYQ